MEEATMGMTSLAYNNLNPNQQADPGDETLLVRFFFHPFPDEAATREAGRPMFKEVECIDIRVPGERRTAIRRRARERDKQRFPRHYQAFLDRVENPEIGTPLTEWPGVNRSMVENLAYMNIKTVEQLAGAPDTAGGSIMGFQLIRQQAQDWLDRAELQADQNAITDLQSQNDELQAQLAEMQAQIAALTNGGSQELEDETEEEQETSEE